jgi:hypothetical protein
MLSAVHRDPISVENSAYPGTPDVNYCDGWIELKVLESWPARESTPARIDHFTQQQRVWLRRRWLIGGNAWLLLVVGREWLLFDGQTAFLSVGKVSRSELFEVAFCSWVRQPCNTSFVNELESGKYVKNI